MKDHFEIIKCPRCESAQKAKVEHSIPFWSFIHECSSCEEFIMESEWDEIDLARIENDELGLYIDLLI